MTLYQEVAEKLQLQITTGYYQRGERLPGVRRLSADLQVSVSTIVQAQSLLEGAGVIMAKPRSGFYICSKTEPSDTLPSAGSSAKKPVPVSTNQISLFLAEESQQKGYIQLGYAVPHSDFLPLRAIQRHLSKSVRQFNADSINYPPPAGLMVLRQQISRRMRFCASVCEPEDIVITNGAQEALNIALRSIASSGDTIAIESPTYYGLLQVIESLDMHAIEIATDPIEGIDIEALESAHKRWPIKACVLIANFQNPLGSLMSDANKQKIVALAQREKFHLIEDDIYGDLNHSFERPRSLHSFESSTREANKQVIYYSSFSKTISPGLRIGWLIVPKRYQSRIQQSKQALNLAGSPISQIAIATYLASGGFDKHLRQLKQTLQQRIQQVSQEIQQHFPPETKVSQPRGGFVLWVEFSAKLDCLALCLLLNEQKINVTPGQLFSPSSRYKNCLRLNCAQPSSPQLSKAIVDIGKAAKHMISQI